MTLSLVLPYLNITYEGVHLSFNNIYGLLLLAFIYDFKIKHSYKITFYLFRPFLFLYIGLIILIPFQSGMPVINMILGWIVNIINGFIVSFVISNLLLYYPNATKYFHYAILSVIAIALFYGTFLMFWMESINPYQILMATINDVNLEENYYEITDDRIFGRISSVFESPQAYGFFLTMSFIYLLAMWRNIPKLIVILLDILLFINIIGCGVRTAIATTLVCAAFYFIKNISPKMILSLILLGTVCMIAISQSRWLEQYINSTVNVKKTEDTGGSSVGMRIIQFDACLDEISDCFIQGKGYGWHGYYRETKGSHPIILAFESLLFMVLCDCGLVGLIIWSAFVFLFVKRAKGQSKTYIVMTIIAYLTYTLITGDYGYMRYFTLFYVLLYFGINNMTDENKSKDYRILSTSVSSNP